MWDRYDQFSGWWFVVMPLAMLAFWGLVAWIVITVVRGGKASSEPPSDAAAILSRRYALGEIDTDEYHQRLDNLHRTGAAPGDRS
jgi:putative membrane protein